MILDQHFNKTARQTALLIRVGDQNRIGVAGAHPGVVLAIIAGGGGDLMGLEIGCHGLQTLPALLVLGIEPRPDNTTRAGGQLLRRRRHRHGESGVALAGDHAVERAPVTGEFNPLHVVPGEPAERQKRLGAQVEGIVTANVGDFLALEVRRCFHFDVTGHGDAETEAGD